MAICCSSASFNLRFHHLSFFIADVIRVPIRIRHRHQRSLRRADADGENFQALLRRVFRRFERTFVVVLAVGEQHERLVMIFFLERRQRRVDGRRERRAALRNGIHVERLHALLKRRVVNRQRTFQKRVARERDQAEPIRAGALHQFQRGELRALEPVRRDVRREHGF